MKGCTAFNREISIELVKVAEAHAIKPLVAKTFAFEDMVQALEELQKQNAVGKLAVRISGD